MNRKKTGLVILVVLCVFLVAGCSPVRSTKEFVLLRRISELATLKTFYHNVAEMEHDGFFLGIGYKKIWVEYSGIVKIGVDPIKITVSKPDDKGVVKVTIPKAKVLGIDFDENSIKEYKDVSLLSGEFSTMQKLEALAQAQDSMELSAGSDTALLMQGQDRAKEAIEKYIQSVGASIGKTYTVEWVELNEE